MTRGFAQTGLVLAGILSLASAMAQMIPDAPIREFRLPLFGDNGYKEWELRGLEGHYLDAGSARVDGLDLLVFSGDADMLLENRIRSPSAVIEFEAARASGDSSLFMTGPGFEIEGRDWIWDGRRRNLTVGHSVRVVFESSLIILK